MHVLEGLCAKMGSESGHSDESTLEELEETIVYLTEFHEDQRDIVIRYLNWTVSFMRLLYRGMRK